MDESLKALEEVEALREKKAALESEYKNATSPFANQQQKLRICDICSAHLGINDNDKRLVDHFGGKLHLGFIEIREKLEDLKVSYQSPPRSSVGSTGVPRTAEHLSAILFSRKKWTKYARSVEKPGRAARRWT